MGTLAAKDSGTLAAKDSGTLAAKDSGTLAAKDSGTLAAKDSGTLEAQARLSRKRWRSRGVLREAPAPLLRFSESACVFPIAQVRAVGHLGRPQSVLAFAGATKTAMRSNSSQLGKVRAWRVCTWFAWGYGSCTSNVPSAW